MRIKIWLAVASVAVLLGLVVITAADPDDCQNALDQLKSAKGDLAYPLKTYVDCVSGSDGTDDCSSEFSNLKSAQDDFESAVSDYGSDCGD